MSEEPKKGAFYALSESSPVRLGLAVAFTGGCMSLVWQVANLKSDLRADISREYVSKELFAARMDEVTRGLSDIKAEVRYLQDAMRGPVSGR